MAGASIDRKVFSCDFAIAASGTTSNGQNLNGMVIMSLAMDGVAWTAADLQFEASFDGTTWLPVYDDAGTRVIIAAAALAASRIYVNKAILQQLAGLTWIRLVSSVAQSSAHTIKMLAKG
jgi:hypothetical protein